MRRKKALGQHFLHDPSVLRGICDALEVAPDEQIIEIGPGTGRLTRKLAERFGAERVVCVERDPDMIAHLAEKLPDVRVEFGDATRYPFDELVNGPAVVCGNLPYNVSTGIYFHLLLEHHQLFR
ncbi:MAG: 16S rRNA (adenine1518-N6/adenine1519-N6)-dimethyltransferase, partial [Myxococcota bacterium]